MKCPKCKSKDIVYREIWRGHSIEYELIGGKLEGYSMEPGNPYRVVGYCPNCFHQWKFRNATQITDIKIK